MTAIFWFVRDLLHLIGAGLLSWLMSVQEHDIHILLDHKVESKYIEILTDYTVFESCAVHAHHLSIELIRYRPVDAVHWSG